MRHPTEDDMDEYRREDREEKGIAHLEERHRREPPIGELVVCEECGGEAIPPKCPRCHGEGVEP